jgi:hypothetical protein
LLEKKNKGKQYLLIKNKFIMRYNRTMTLDENRLRETAHRVVKTMLREGYQQMMYNDEGEPIGMEYVPDQYEQEEMDWEERMHRHDDPSYAAAQESQEWYQRACAAFESQGVEVPEDVKYALAREMRAKQRKEQQQAEMAKMEPLVDAIYELGYVAEPIYEPETPAEEAYAYINVSKNGRSISREELQNLRNALVQNGYDEALIDDYVTSGY